MSAGEQDRAKIMDGAMRTDAPWNHNIHYHPLVIDAVPANCARALDVGCGDGLLASKLAERCGTVVAIDSHHETLVRARATYASQQRITFVEGDVLTAALPEGGFEFIVAVATLHHLDTRAALTRFRELLAPGGVLLIVGLSRPRSLMDWIWSAAGSGGLSRNPPVPQFRGSVGAGAGSGGNDGRVARAVPGDPAGWKLPPAAVVPLWVSMAKAGITRTRDEGWGEQRVAGAGWLEK